jgi:hypothetical protein
LTVNGTAILGGAVGGVTELASLTLNNGAALNGGPVTTAGAQAYNGPVILGVDDTLSGSTVGLNSTVDGAHNLTVNGTAILGGAVGGVTELASLTLNNGAALNGGPVKTTGAQTYNGPVILGVDDTLSGSTVTFGSTVDGAHALTVNGTANSAGPVAFNGVVGGTTELTGLTITAGTVVAGVDTSENASFTLSVPVYVSGNMSVTAGGDFEITPAVHANDKISIHANNGSDNTSINVSGNLSVTAGGDVAINAPVNVTDDMSITAGGNVNFNALITGPATGPVYDPENVTDTLSVTSGGSISQTSVGIITFANLHLSASDPITLVDAGNQFANVQAEYNNDNLYFGSVVNSSDQVYGQNDLYAGNADVALPELGGKLLGQVAAAINPEPKRQETIQTEPGSFSTAPPPGYILRSSQMSGE